MPRGSNQLAESREGELLLLLARVAPDAAARARAGELLPRLDWDVFRALTRRHGVGPLVYRSLAAFHADAATEALLSDLRGEFHGNARVNLQRILELKRLLRVLAAAEIPVLVLKGPAVAQMAYGDPGLRTYGDLDILVPPAALRNAVRLVRECGYAPLWPLTPDQERTMLRHGYHYNLRSDDGSSYLEIHWRAIDACFAFALPDRELWLRRTAVWLGSDPVDTLAPEDQLLFVSLHGAKHFWSSLKMVCDVAELVNRFPQLDWTALVKTASSLGSERMLRLGLRLADELLRTRLPDEIRAWVRSDRSLTALVDDALGFLALGEAEAVTVASMTAFHLRLLPGLAPKARYLRASLAPKELDVLVFPLPAALSPLYLFLRPLRLLLRLKPPASAAVSVPPDSAGDAVETSP